MSYFHFVWPDEVIDHIAEHGISQDEFEFVICNPEWQGFSRSSGRPTAWAHLPDGRQIFAVYDELDDASILPVTAYEVA